MSVVLAGDHLDISSSVDLRSQITVIQAYIRRIGARTRLLVCSGNHDLDARNAAGVKYARWIQRARQFGVPTDSDSLKVGSTLFTVCPWWDGPESCREIAPLFDRDNPVDKERWIWVYHAPAQCVPDVLGRQAFFRRRPAAVPGSSSTSQTWCSPGTSTSRHSKKTARGSTA